MKKIILIGLLLLCLMPAAYANNETNATNLTSVEFTKNQYWPYDESFNFPQIVRENQSFDVYVQINNTGSINATNISVSLAGTINQSWIKNATNASKETLEPNETLESVLTLQVPETGAYEITAVVDASNANSTNLTRELSVVNQSSLLVRVGKSANTLNYTISAPENVLKEAQFTINVTLTNTGNATVDELLLGVVGINNSYIIETPVLAGLAAGNTTTASILLNVPVAETYNISVSGTAWYNVSVDNGSTSYDAFSKITNLDASWNGWPLNAYLLDGLDGVANDWSKGWSWSYYKNAVYSDCGVGCTGGWGCPQGDMMTDGGNVELRYNNYGADWSIWPPVQVPLQTVQINVNDPPAPPSPQPSGGGGGGVAGPTLPQESAKFGNMNAGTSLVVPVQKSDELGVTDVKLDVNEDVRNAIVKVLKYETKPNSVPDAASGEGKAFAYLNIQKFNFKDEALEKAEIRFKIEKAWLEKNDLDEDTVILQRYDEEWQNLPTSKRSSTASYIYYGAETPGFSIFAITAEKKLEPVPEEVRVEEEPVEEEVLPEEKEEETTAPTGLVTLKKSAGIGAFIVFMFMAGLLLVRYIRR